MSVDRVVIVILNWNGWRDTDACLESLKRLAYPSFDIVVVDNASQDGSEARIRELHPDVRLLQSGSNLGFAGGYNLGIRDALARGAEYVWVLNNDTLVDPDALDHLVAKMRRDPSCGICGSTLVDADGSGRVQALGGSHYDRWTGRAHAVGAGGTFPEDLAHIDADETEARLDHIAGASMFVSRRFLEATGLMDEGYFLFFEELDWIARMPRHLTLGYAPRSVVYHKDGASIGKNPRDRDVPAEKRLRYEYYLVRSRLRFTTRHAPQYLPTVVATLFVTLGVRVLRGEWQRAWILVRAMARLARGAPPPDATNSSQNDSLEAS